jgi:hypothetical protein
VGIHANIRTLPQGTFKHNPSSKTIVRKAVTSPKKDAQLRWTRYLNFSKQVFAVIGSLLYLNSNEVIHLFLSGQNNIVLKMLFHGCNAEPALGNGKREDVRPASLPPFQRGPSDLESVWQERYSTLLQPANPPFRLQLSHGRLCTHSNLFKCSGLPVTYI